MESKVWYKSKGIIGALIVVVAWLAQQGGIAPDAATSGAIVGSLDEGLTLVGGLLALWGRLTAATKIG